MQPTLALVGHCGIDGPRLQSELSRQFPEHQVVRCNRSEDLGGLCNEDCLLMFNRELVGDFESDQGLEMIQQIKQKHPDVRVMLISDLQDAQEAAEKSGALPGFGKAELGSSRQKSAIGQALQLH